VKNGSLWTREFNLRDHLGNVRVVIRKGGNGQAEIVQQKGYYPFGGEISQFSTGTGTNRHWYNGKELQDDLNLYWYDYGARFYDPELGRWHSVDPLASDYPSWTPYHYVHNNPIVLIDPTGMSADWYQSDAGNLIWQDKSDATITINGEEFKNIGKSVSIGNSEDRFINYYENVSISLSNAPVNAGAKVLNNQGLKGQLIEKNSPLSERSKSDLFFSSIHNATGQAAEIMFEAAMWVAPMPKIGLLGKGASWLNKTLATSYLSKAGQLANFKAVEGFSLGVGQKTFKYHNSFTAASRTPWSSPTLFKSQGSAFNSLALDYPKTSNFAQARFQTKRFGVFVRGTAQRQGMTFGGGTQLLKTSFGSYSKPIVLPW
jgi:RHS repeat-associated protein